jgi:hypothetical protein
MDYATAQIYAASGFKMVRNIPGWVTDEDFNIAGVAPADWIVKFVVSSTGGTYTPLIYVNGTSSAYTPSGAESAATDWSVIP